MWVFNSFDASELLKFSSNQVLGMNIRKLIQLLLFIIVLIQSKADVTTMIDKIIRDVLKDYNPSARPIDQASDKGIKLGIDVRPVYFTINSETSTLHSYVLFILDWKDSRLKWEPMDYENVSQIHVSPKKIWSPDAMVYNGVEHFDYKKTDVHLYSSGWVSIKHTLFLSKPIPVCRSNMI